MKLLHYSWSELLVLDIVSRQVLYGKEDSLLLVTGCQVSHLSISKHSKISLNLTVSRGYPYCGMPILP